VKPESSSSDSTRKTAATIYAYSSLQALLEGEFHGGAKTPLPGAGAKAVTERPG
jgi:hypothetical protein